MIQITIVYLNICIKIYILYKLYVPLKVSTIYNTWCQTFQVIFPNYFLICVCSSSSSHTHIIVFLDACVYRFFVFLVCVFLQACLYTHTSNIIFTFISLFLLIFQPFSHTSNIIFPKHYLCLFLKSLHTRNVVFCLSIIFICSSRSLVSIRWMHYLKTIFNLSKDLRVSKVPTGIIFIIIVIIFSVCNSYLNHS